MFRSVLLVAVCASVSVAVLAQDKAQYQPFMRAAQADLGALRMAVMAKNTKAAQEAGGKLAVTFNNVLAFWQQRNVADAIIFATTARDEARAIADTSDPDVQATDMMKLQEQCGNCHMAHRAGTPPNFEIK